MKKNPVIGFILLTFGIGWGLLAVIYFFLPNIFAEFYVFSAYNPLIVLALYAPTLAALIMAAATHGKKAVSALLHKLVIWNVDLKYYLFSVVGVLALGLMVALIWSRLPNEHANEWQEILPLFMNLVIAGPLAEELGWRGFALPALLKKWNPLLASLFLGVMRAVWYLPFFLLPGMPQSRMAIPVFLLAAIAISIISTWLYTNTRGSVFLPILFNLCINIALIIFGAPSYAITTSIFVVAIVLVLSSLPEWLNRQLEPTLY